MKRALAIAAVLALTLGLLAGCAGNPIVGKWALNLGVVTITAEFKSDNTYVIGYSDGSTLVMDNGPGSEFSVRNDTLSVSLPGFPSVTMQRVK